MVILDVTEQTRARLRAIGQSMTVEMRRSGALDLLATLQNALLPDGLPTLAAVDLAASYRLADDDQSAGGDWFDALAVDDDVTALVVGDVVGHRVERQRCWIS